MLQKIQGVQSRKMARIYRSEVGDLTWARNEIGSTVINGESILVVHSRVVDVEFNDLDIIPLLADKVFERNLSNTYVMLVFDGARDFFSHLFTSPVRLNKRGGLLEGRLGVCLWYNVTCLCHTPIFDLRPHFFSSQK